MEALIVVGLLALLALLAVPKILQALQRYQVSEAANQMAVHLRFVRNACVQRKIPFRVIVNTKDAVPDPVNNIVPNTYTILHDPTRTNNYVVYSRLSKVVLPTDVQILDSAAYPNPTALINFTSRGSANAGDINLQGADTGIQYRLDVKLTGAVTVTKTGG